MSASPFLSVIMPVYNAEQYVQKAVESVLAQTFSDLEIICVNDASRDGSLAILMDLQKTDSRIKVIDSKENVGAGGARNLGLKAACGQYITFMDADDTIESDLYERAAGRAKESGADEVVWGLVEEHYDAADKLIRTIPIMPKTQIVTELPELTALILELEEYTLFGYQWNSFYRADIIREKGIRFEKSLFYEDYFFNLEFAKYMQSLATLEFAGYHYFKRVNGSITHQFTKDYFELSYRRIDTMYTFCAERGYVSQRAIDVLGNRLLRYTLSAVCRNFDKQAQMSGQERKQWFLDVCARPLYGQVVALCKPANLVFSLVKFSLMHRSAMLMLMLGKMTQLLRR